MFNITNVVLSILILYYYYFICSYLVNTQKLLKSLLKLIIDLIFY